VFSVFLRARVVSRAIKTWDIMGVTATILLALFALLVGANVANAPAAAQNAITFGKAP
jgi:hypothetical protein